MNNQAWSDDFYTLLHTLHTQRHRLWVVLSGEVTWQNTVLNALFSAQHRLAQTPTHWLSLPLNPEFNTEFNPEFNPTLNPAHLTEHAHITTVSGASLAHRLGQEVDGVLLDASQGLSANQLGMVSGMVRAGGLLVLLTPPVDIWRTAVNPENARFLNTPYTLDQAWSYFNEYLIHQWQSPSQHPVLWLKQHDEHIDQAWSNALQQLKTLNAHHAVQDTLPTADQHAALQAIHSVAFGHRKRPLVISADRGRGKSSVLGLGAIDCLLAGKQHIVLTAPKLEQLHSAFTQTWLQCKRAEQSTQSSTQNSPSNAIGSLSQLSQSPGRVSFMYQGQLKTLEFIAPDQLLLTPNNADVLMIDEAAQLPTPMLSALLAQYHRLVFATTLHGYEGSGRGFELRFKQTLQRQTPQWKSVHLTQPIRYHANDPLEHAIERALCLNAQTSVFGPNDLLPNALNLDCVTVDTFDIHALFNAQNSAHEEALRDFSQLFSLLVHAHYQTSPNDLQQLLNAPNLRIEVARFQHKIVGVLVSVAEGDWPLPHQHTQRLHGHLVPQLLANHTAANALLALRTWRVMRIAVHPQCQRLGIGHALLNHWQTHAQQQQVDYLSASFGAHADLVRFWLKQGYTPYHLGVKRDKASGTHNAVLIKPMHSAAHAALRPSQIAFAQQFAHNLIESLNELEADIIWLLLTALHNTLQNALESASCYAAHPDALQPIMGYANGQRPFESISGQLWHFSLNQPAQFSALSHRHQAIWCDKILKKQPWSTVATTHQLAGRADVENQLKQVLITLYNAQNA
ncbi:GNAT family N-acetyltransferase [Thiomicrorhabdus aquaedulcis]|uniref:GNAT family N-acetyltransferase n=1 Tax=Thiomicrorhabdus aquaedulcis TaxID=2211106 RepID=UPI000FDBED1F|nr:GNAT family N-acetyltransferase [Thiomicrorhabdus aquaedulcis]